MMNRYETELSWAEELLMSWHLWGTQAQAEIKLTQLPSQNRACQILLNLNQHGQKMTKTNFSTSLRNARKRMPQFSQVIWGTPGLWDQSDRVLQCSMVVNLQWFQTTGSAMQLLFMLVVTVRAQFENHQKFYVSFLFQELLFNFNYPEPT